MGLRILLSWAHASKSLQTITQMSRQLWPGNRRVFNYRTNVQTVAEHQSSAGEHVAESSQCVKEPCRFWEHPVGVLSPSKVRWRYQAQVTLLFDIDSEGSAQTKRCWSSDWMSKPTFQTKEVRSLDPSLGTWPSAACQMGQFRVFGESVPWQILLLGLLVIPGPARETRVLQFDKKSRAYHTSFNHNRSTKSPR